MAASLLRDRPTERALSESFTWALVSAAVFTGWRYRQPRRGATCALCKDTPDQAPRPSVCQPIRDSPSRALRNAMNNLVRDCAAFPANAANDHHLFNRGDSVAVSLEGSRSVTDFVVYSDIDMVFAPRIDGYAHKDGTAYPPK